MTLLQTTQQAITANTQIGLTFGEMATIVGGVIAIILTIWRIKANMDFKIQKLRTDTDLKIQKLESEFKIKVANLEKDIMKIQSDNAMCRTAHDLQTSILEKHVKDWIENNNTQHTEMFNRINDMFKFIVDQSNKK